MSQIIIIEDEKDEKNKKKDNLVKNNSLIWTKFIKSKSEFTAEDIYEFDESLRESNHKIFFDCKNKKGYYLSSPYFWTRLFESKHSIIIDRYFDHYMLKSLELELSKKPTEQKFDLKIITSAIDLDDPQKQISINSLNSLDAVLKEFERSNIEILYSSLSNFHDRFAILDDEIWHFGAAVGNMHHDLTAYTINSSRKSIVEYFERLCNKATNLREYLNARNNAC